MALAVDLKNKCFCVITGASQGIGRALAVEFAQKMESGSVMVLMARNKDGLEETKSLIKNPNVEVIIRPVDLAKITTAKDTENILSGSLSADINKFDTNIIIHNAGSVGDLSFKADELNDLTVWQTYYNLNVFNVAVLNCAFMKMVTGYEKKTLVINITSLCGIKPFAGLALYGSGKAAREMYFKVLAEERPELKVLNYSPGPVKTAMVANIAGTTTNADLKSLFTSMIDENKLLLPEQTAKKCLDVVSEGKYKSGDHVDYFD